MKNLTILLLLMLCEYTFSQSSKLIIYSNVDSARIIIDDKEVGLTTKLSELVIPINHGKHNLSATWRAEVLNIEELTIKKGKRTEIDVIFNPENEQGKSKIILDAPIFLVAEEPAMFQGGDLSLFNLWIGQNIQYPKEAVEKGITGKVYVQFVVSEEGSIERPKILRGANQILDNEAVRVIMTSPKWSPAKQAGIYVKQMFTIPVLFRLTESQP